MKRVSPFLLATAILVTTSQAVAQPDVPVTGSVQRPTPPSPTIPDKPRANEEGQEPAIGYRVEAGLATTHISQGTWKYATKETPATEDFAGVRFRFGRYGMTTVGGSASIALASASSQPTNAMELTPTITHAIQLSPVVLTTGFRVKLFPRASDVDGAYEGILRTSLPNPYVTPVFELAPEFVRKRGVYGLVGAEHRFAFWKVTITPRAQFGMQGYDDRSERIHANEVMVTSPARLSFGAGMYTLLNPGYSILVGPSHYFKDPSVGGRSVAFAMLTFGAER